MYNRRFITCIAGAAVFVCVASRARAVVNDVPLVSAYLPQAPDRTPRRGADLPGAPGSGAYQAVTESEAAHAHGQRPGTVLQPLPPAVGIGAQEVPLQYDLKPATDLIVVFKDGAAAAAVQAKPQGTFASCVAFERALPRAAVRPRTLALAEAPAARNMRNMYRAVPAAGVALEEALRELTASPLVEYAAPNDHLNLHAYPNDTLFYPHQWSLYNTGQTFFVNQVYETNGFVGADIKWLQAYEAGILPTNPTTVAVSDTGIDISHPDLAGQLWHNPGEIPGNGIDDDGNGYVDDYYGYDFVRKQGAMTDMHGHGTHVAGTIAAATGNGAGIAGVHPGARIMGIKCASDNGSLATLDAIEGLIYAADMGADVINCSWGGYSYNAALRDAIAYAAESGASVVCSAGNDNVDATTYPAGYPYAVSVAASDPEDAKAYFSNYAKTVDVAAPGLWILSLRAAASLAGISVISNDYRVWSGTSMAAPCAAGAMALFRQWHPGFNSWTYEKAFSAAADPSILDLPYNNAYKTKLGGGRVDLLRAHAYNATNVFIDGWLVKELTSGVSPAYYAAPGETLYAAVKVGTWKHSVANLSVRVRRISTTSITINGGSSATLTLGTLPGYAVTLMPSNAFTIVVSSSAAYGSKHTIRIELMQGSTVLRSQDLELNVFSLRCESMRVADLDGDGRKEIIVAGYSRVQVLNADGALRWVYPPAEESAANGTTVAIGDINGDGTNEIVYCWRNPPSPHTLTALTGDGTWLFTSPVHSDYRMPSGLALGDINGDGAMEIFVNAAFNPTLDVPSAPFYDRLTVLNGDGSTRFYYGTGYRYTQPAIGDMDGDGTNEFVFFRNTAGGNLNPAVVIANGAGAIVRVFPITMPLPGSANLHLPPTLADVDSDGCLEIIGRGFTFEGKLFASDGAHVIFIYRADGTPLPGWPQLYDTVGGGISYNSTPVGDMDGDGRLELYTPAVTERLLKGFRHDGTVMAGFPLSDPVVQRFTMPLLADLNADGAPDFVYPKFDQWGDDYNIMARAGSCLKLPGYPLVIPWESLPECDAFTFDYLEAGGGQSNAVFLLHSSKNVLIYNAGCEFDPRTVHWTMPYFDIQRSSRHRWPRTGRLRMVFNGAPRTGINAITTQFACVIADGTTNGLAYAWDFNNDGVTDSSAASPAHLYATPGVYSVRLTVSNAPGETCTVVHDDYIQVVPPLGADFSANLLTAAAPAQISFASCATNLPQFWHWEFGDGSSTNGVAHPAHLYGSVGAYTVRLTVSNLYDSSVTIAKTNYIVINDVVANVSTHYVATAGLHVPPFKTWREAATNIAAALDARGHHAVIMVDDGTYYEGGFQVRGGFTNVLITSKNGPLMTIIDAQYRSGIFYIYATNIIVDGFTLRHGRTSYGGAIQAGLPLNGNAFGCGVRNCIIVNNIAVGGQGAPTGGGALLENTSIDTCVIMSNFALFGGGLANYTASSNLVMIGNEGLYEGSAVWGSYSLNSLWKGAGIYNSLFTGNRGYAAVASARLYNCTLTRNAGTNGYINSAELFNCVVRNNDGRMMANYNNTLFLNNITPRTDLNSKPGSAGNITGEPGFLDPAAGNYRLAPSSPCINTGTNYVRYSDEPIPGKIMRFDFGVTNLLSSPNWNNVTTFTTGLKIDNAVYTDGTLSSVDLYMDRALAGTSVDAVAYPGYPSSATDDSFYNTANSTTVVFRFTGLDSAKQYTVRVLPGGTSAYQPLISINGDPQDTDHDSPASPAYNQLAVLKNFWTLADGSLRIVIRSVYTSVYRWHVAMVELQELTPVPLPQVTFQHDLDGNKRLHGDRVDMGCYEYDSRYAPRAVLEMESSEPRPGLPALFSGSNSYDYAGGVITNYAWLFGDGTHLSGPALSAVSHVYSQPGQYLVTLCVTDNDGMTNAAQRVVFAAHAVPRAPANFAASPAGVNAIHLQWDDVAHETGYVLGRGGLDGAPYDVVIDQDDDAVTYFAGAYPQSKDNDWGAFWPATNGNDSAHGPLVNVRHWYVGNVLQTRYRISGGYDPEYGSLSFKRVEFRPNIPGRGMYEIYEWHPRHTTSENDPQRWRYDGYGVVSRATPHYIYGALGAVQQQCVDQRVNCGQWNLLGVYDLAPGSYVLIDTVGLLFQNALADAMRFLRLADYAPMGGTPQDVVTYHDPALAIGTTYTYYLKATNQYGSSPWVKTYVFLPDTNAAPVVSLDLLTPTNGAPPLAVSGFASASDPDGAITNCTWDFGSGYVGAILAGPALTSAYYTYQYPGQYRVVFTACDNHGQRASATGTVTIAYAAPSAPSGLAATLLSFSQIRVTWTDNAVTEQSFEVQRKSGTAAFLTIAELPANSTLYTDSGLSDGIIHTYRVRARNQYGDSDWSNEGSARTPALPRATIPYVSTNAGPVGVEVLFAGVVTLGDAAITNMQWDFGDGTPLTNDWLLTNVVHFFDYEGTFTTTFTVADAAGFNSAATRITTVTPEPLLAAMALLAGAGYAARRRHP